MSSSRHSTIMSLQSIEKYYHEVYHNDLSYSAMTAIVSGKSSSYLCISRDLLWWFTTRNIRVNM